MEAGEYFCRAYWLAVQEGVACMVPYIRRVNDKVTVQEIDFGHEPQVRVVGGR